jgi:hypothetical protein
MQQFVNNYDELVTGIVSPGDLVIPVSSAADLPILSVDNFVLLTIEITETGIREIVKATGVVGNDITVVRAQEGTIAGTFPSGTIIQARVTAASLSDLQGIVGSLNDLTDVNNSSPSSRDVLAYDGVDSYDNRPLVELDISDLQAYLTDITGQSVGDLNDVNSVTPSARDVLAYDGVDSYDNRPLVELDISDLQAYLTDITGQSIKSLSDVLTSMTPLEGDALTYLSGEWKAQAGGGGTAFWDTEKIKPLDESILNNATITVDSDFTIALDASSTYEFELLTSFDADNNFPGMKYRVDYTGTVIEDTGNIDLLHKNTASTVNSYRLGSTFTIGFLFNNREAVRIKGILETDTGGDLRYSWAQGTLDAVFGTNLYKGSLLRVRKLI